MSKFKVGDKVVFAKNLIDGERYDGFTYHSQIMPQNTVFEVLDIQHGGGSKDIWYGVKTPSKMRIAVSAEMIELTEQPRHEFIVIRRSGAETIAELRHDREVIKSAKATCAPSDTFDLDTGAKLAFDRLMGREMITFSYEIAPDKEPQPAHRFKVGDRVDTGHQRVGTVIFVDVEPDAENKSSYLVRGEKNWDGEAWIGCVTDEKITSGKGCDWFKYYQLSHAPAPEPPKFYTGKVVCVEDLHHEPSRVGMIFEFVDGQLQGDNKRMSDLTVPKYESFEQFARARNAVKWIEVRSDV